MPKFKVQCHLTECRAMLTGGVGGAPPGMEAALDMDMDTDTDMEATLEPGSL